MSFCFRLMAVSGLVVASFTANAATFSFNFTEFITGDPYGGTNVATLTIADSGSDQVLVTLSHNATSLAGQFIGELWFNMDPFQVPTQTNQTPANKFNGGITAALNGTGSAGISFDLNQSFQTSNAGGGVNRLKPGESISFNLSGPGLDATDFLSKSVGNRTDLYAMIHLQGTPNGGSVKLGAVPEPASMAVLGLGIVPFLRRRRN